MKPAVSIIVPLFNDEEWVAAALDSCLKQTSGDFEVLCIDDASTDGTLAIIEEYAARDSRIRLIQQPQNASAFQARRVGVDAAAADYVLFLDGDDELAPNAVKIAITKAKSTAADVVGLGVEIIAAKSGVPHRFQAALQPRHNVLRAAEIVSSIFPAGEEANGHLWRYLWATQLLRTAYAGFPSDVAYYRANDLPITFLALSHAKKYVSVAERLYRYNFQRGTSGHEIDNVEHFKFLLSGIDPISDIGNDVVAVSQGLARPDLLDNYKSARLHIIGNVLRYCIRDTAGALQEECLRLLKNKVGELDVVRAAAGFVPAALEVLTAQSRQMRSPVPAGGSVVLWTAHLRTGGLQSVLLNHARELRAAGYRVTIAVMMRAQDELEVPQDIGIVHIAGSLLERLDQWADLCHEHEVDVIIDHHLLYNDNWPWFALTASAVGVPTIGWLHNFALRPIFDANERTTFLATHMPMLKSVVTLSPTDVAFWKMQGVERVVYLPNPPSALSMNALKHGSPRAAAGGRWELAWWGRLDGATKQLPDLVAASAHLKRLGLDFRLTIIGPNSDTLSAADLRELAIEHGVDDSIAFYPGLDPDQLVAVLSRTHLMVSASAIEGYQLTIIEAQALGIPVVMYDLPWLTTVVGNPGVVTTSPGDPAGLAAAVAKIIHDPELYSRLSRAGLEFAHDAVSLNMGELLSQLLENTLPEALSPEPTIDHARIVTQWLVRYAERSTRHQQTGSVSSDRQLRRERDRALGELRSIKDGPSFRIGRAVTAFPRKVRDLGVVKKVIARRGLADAATKKRSAQVSPSATPDVSFVIPVYNSAPWIKQCVTSVLDQSGITLEVICIDDGSTDDSADVLRALAKADSRVTVVSQRNSGQSVGRNRGLDLAVGRYVIYLDSDDYWPRDALKKLVTEADENALDVLLFDARSFKDGAVDDKTWKRYSTYYQRARSYREVRTGVQLMSDMRQHRDYRPHVGMYMTRTAYVKALGLQFIPGIVHQDNPYTFGLLLNASRVAHVRLDAYARRLRPGSTITTLNPQRSARGYFLSYLEISRRLANFNLPAAASSQVLNIVEYVYRGAQQPFTALSESEAEEIRLLDPSEDAQELYRLLRANSPAPADPAQIHRRTGNAPPHSVATDE